MLIFLAACAAPDGKPVDGAETGLADTADTTDSAADTGDPTASCAPDHALLDITPEVVEAVYVPEWSYLSWQLDAWLTLNGLGWLTPTTYDVSTWRVRYTTQDRGAPVEATALVSVPVLAGEAAVGTVLWLHPTAGFEDACAPSIGAVEGLAPPIVSAARGYVAVAPDYLGLAAFGDPAPDPHPWIVAEPSAVASLDALRAVDAWLETGDLAARIDRERIVYWGWSEGGYVALQSDRHAPSYAPDHAAAGVIAAVPPVDVLGQVTAGLETFGPATRAGALILYLHRSWYDPDFRYEALLPEVLDALPGEIEASCTTWPSVDGAAEVGDIYAPNFVQAVGAGAPFDPWTCMLERSSLPSPYLPYESDAPVLLVTATDDTLVPSAPVEAAIPALCDEGYTLEHVSCDGLEHGEAPVMTLQDQIRWLDARMDGDPVDPGCGVGAPVTCDG